VIGQGDRADSFFIVAGGRFVVSQAGSDGRATVLRELSRGDGFGEIGLLRGSPRTATVAAATDGRLLELDREAFFELVADGPDLRTGLLARYTTPAAPVPLKREPALERPET
jgi:CRP-like cAMP-binding protein